MANPFFDDEGLKNAGHDDVDVPQNVERTVEDWESGTLYTDVWREIAGTWSVQSSVVQSGSLAVTQGTSSATVLYSESGLDTYPQAGDFFSFYTYLNNDDQSSVSWCIQEGTHNSGKQWFHNSYNIAIKPDRFLLLKTKNKNNVIIEEDSTVSVNSNEWYRVDVFHGEDGEVNATLFDSIGNSVSSISFTDTEYKTGGVGLGAAQKGGTQEGIYWDSFTLQRREPEARTNTQKGTTQLGNEVVPSGAINTGPQEVPPDHPNYPMVNLPVTDDLAQGEQVGYHLAINEEKALTVEAEADGNGGTWDRTVTPEHPMLNLERRSQAADGSYSKHLIGENAVAGSDSGGDVFYIPMDPDFSLQYAGHIRGVCTGPGNWGYTEWYVKKGNNTNGVKVYEKDTFEDDSTYIRAPSMTYNSTEKRLEYKQDPAPASTGGITHHLTGEFFGQEPRDSYKPKIIDPTS